MIPCEKVRDRVYTADYMVLLIDYANKSQYSLNRFNGNAKMLGMLLKARNELQLVSGQVLLAPETVLSLEQ